MSRTGVSRAVRGARSWAISPGQGLYEFEAGIGVRIVDVVVNTPDGCENISTGDSGERAELEARVAEQGTLEVMENAGR